MNFGKMRRHMVSYFNRRLHEVGVVVEHLIEVHIHVRLQDVEARVLKPGCADEAGGTLDRVNQEFYLVPILGGYCVLRKLV
jgi:hypothetical protein